MSVGAGLVLPGEVDEACLVPTIPPVPRKRGEGYFCLPSLNSGRGRGWGGISASPLNPLSHGRGDLKNRALFPLSVRRGG